MRSAAARGIPVVVLDRPDPIGGARQGNAPDPGLATDLTVVPAAGWRRELALDETGLPFVPPSPNLRSVESLFHYPGLCLFEGTNLSVGRGSDAPFEQVGAPWLDTVAVLQQMRRGRLPGVRLHTASFTPRHP